jgi:FkbM family methyltransferase
MAVSVIERVIHLGRPFLFKGKGVLLEPLAARSGTRTATVAGTFAMSLDLANAIHRQIFMGTFARDMTRWARTLLPAGGTFLDVGAHAGYFSLLAADRVGPHDHVHAVEPNPRTFDTLRRHLDRNAVSQVRAHHCGLADRAGTLRLHAPAGTHDYNATMLPRADWAMVEVPARRLDDCLTEWGVDRIDLMKMDVEGAEPLVVAGGAESLARGVVRHLMVEVNGPRLTEGGSSPSAFFATLARLGFRPGALSGDRVVARDWSTLDANPEHEEDCLFVHRSVET